jgi:hypothetical protein
VLVTEPLIFDQFFNQLSLSSLRAQEPKVINCNHVAHQQEIASGYSPRASCLMIILQSLFIVGVILLLCYLVIDGLLTRSVWVKGGRKSPFSFRQ